MGRIWPAGSGEGYLEVKDFSQNSHLHLAEAIAQLSPESYSNQIISAVTAERPWQKADYKLSAFITKLSLFLLSLPLLFFLDFSLGSSLLALSLISVWNLFLIRRLSRLAEKETLDILHCIRTRTHPSPTHWWRLPVLFSLFYTGIVCLYWFTALTEDVLRWGLLFGALVTIDNAVSTYPNHLLSFQIKQRWPVDPAVGDFQTGAVYLLFLMLFITPYGIFLTFVYCSFPFWQTKQVAITEILLAIGIPVLFVSSAAFFGVWKQRLKIRHILNFICKMNGDTYQH